MDTGRFKMVKPEQLVRDERKRAEADAAEIRKDAQPSKRASVAGKRTVARTSTARTRPGSTRSGATRPGSTRSGATQPRSGSSASAQGTGDGRSAASSRATGARRGSHASTSAESPRAARNREAEESTANRLPRITPLKVIVLIVLVALIVVIAQLCSSASSITVTVNGTQHTLHGAKTLQTAVKESGLPLNSGDFISLQGNVLRRHEGHPFAATVNDEATVDPDFPLHNGDVITLSDGEDIVEDYEAVPSAIPYEASIVGTGSIHTFTPGEEGVMETRTGLVSGEVVEKQTVDPKDLLETRTDIGVGNNKVIALTFDDGPSALYTEEILNILAENDAKATFFCLGTAAQSEGGAELVKKAADQGCQICSHSYSYSSIAGNDISALAPEAQQNEILQGYQVLANILGYEPAHYVRVGAEDLYTGVVLNVASLIDAEINWTVDTGDWVYLSEDEIYDTLMSAKPGDIIRMHDGGDHQDITAAALKRALPKLKENGYSFITLDELMAYAPAN